MKWLLYPAVAFMLLVAAVLYAPVSNLLFGTTDLQGILIGPYEETFRYRLTIKVTVDGDTYTGSSVIEATQTRGTCALPGASSYCYPHFTAKGVAPMITLPDGAVIFASLKGLTVSNPPGINGVDVSRLPWLIHVDDWDLSPQKPMVYLPKPTPRVEIPFEGHPKSKFRPVMWYVPPQELGPPEGRQIGPDVASQYTSRDIELVSFTIEPTRDPLTDWLDPAPSWMSGYRGGRGYTKEQLEERRQRIIRERRQLYPPRRPEIETSLRML